MTPTPSFATECEEAARELRRIYYAGNDGLPERAADLLTQAAAMARPRQVTFEHMRQARLQWVRERASANLSCPDDEALAAYHRGFNDALDAAIAAQDATDGKEEK